jgi:hypothetical protein
MKSRAGFVSNSSTTSYILLVKPDMVESLDLILRYAGSKNRPSEPVKKRRKKLSDEVMELAYDIEFVTKLQVNLEMGYTKDRFDFHNFLVHINYMHHQSASIRHIRQYPPDFSESIEDYRNTLDKFKKELAKMLNDYKNQLSLMEGKDGWNILEFEEDANFGKLNDMVKDLVKKKQAVILHQETT